MAAATTSYHDINSSEKEIRLLSIAPGTADEPVSCRLSATRLGSQPYDALSYVWGGSPENSPNSIILNGHRFPVTPNLDAALRRYRLQQRSERNPIWVDAVCINQGNPVERSQQVAMMGDIYASADRVIIWLGEADDGSDDAFDVIPALAACSGRKHPEESGDEIKRDLIQRCISFFFSLASDRPWFSRVWILQELALAKSDALVLCGSKCVSWSALMRAWKAIAQETFREMGLVRSKHDDSHPDTDQSAPDKDSEEEAGLELTGMTKIDLLDDLRKSTQREGGYSLRKLLLISRSSSATDPRDRIYALLGLLKGQNDTSGDSVAIPVDYGKSADAVYADAMAHLFSIGEGPYFLSGVFLPGVSADAPAIPGPGQDTLQVGKFPSWVPDFSRQMFDLARQPNGTQFHPPAGISASGAGQSCCNGKVLACGRTLQIEGLFVDNVEQVVHLGDSVGELVGKLPDLDALFLEAQRRPGNFEARIRQPMAEFKKSEPLWRLLISNKKHMSGYDAAPSSYEASYLTLLDRARSQPCGTSTSTGTSDIDLSEYELCLKTATGKRAFFITRSGLCGTCVPDTKAGDVVAILFGSPTPFVLRPGQHLANDEIQERDTYLLVGGSYVGGIMHGEMVDELYCEDLMDSTTFFIE